MEARRRIRKRRQSVALPEATPTTEPRASNDVPPELIPFVNALAELLVRAYRRKTIERGTGNSPERPKAKTKDR
jgi:hypothetical protein